MQTITRSSAMSRKTAPAYRGTPHLKSHPTRPSRSPLVPRNPHPCARGCLASAVWRNSLLARADRHARVVVLLVGLLRALGVANLGLQVVVVLGLVLAHAVPEGPLRVGVDVHLDGARLDGVA